MRRLIAFDCAGETLAGTLDLPDGAVEHGLLIVSGGNEVRAGAHRGMALLAARLAADGVAVLRYDRRGIGDSGGENRGWSGARDDLATALAVLRRETGAARVTGFGNCDAAALLALDARSLGIDAVVLANPWTGGSEDGLPPATAIRAGYAAKLRDPREWVRLLRGEVDWRKLAAGLRKVARRRAPAPLADRLVRAIADWGADATIVLAEGDATAIAFAAAARGTATETIVIPTASHGFARTADKAALERVLRQALRRA